MRKQGWKALTALVVAFALVACAAGGAVPALAAGTRQLQIGILSDAHVLPEGVSDHRGAVMESVLAAFAAHAKQNGLRYVLIPGDLTRDGELSGHRLTAQRLERFEKETGIQVAVVPGNHDINNGRDGDPTKPEQFRELYRNLGYDLPGVSYYTPPAGKKGGMLSYAADLEGGFRLIAMDVCKYSSDQTPKGNDGYDTGGMISEALMKWILEECRQAQRAGKTIIGMMHHSLTPHMGPQEYILLDFMLDDWLRVRETLTDAGMHYVLTGHMHVNEIGSSVSDDGETLFDIATASLVNFPCQFREVKFTAKGKNDLTAEVKAYEADCVKPVAKPDGGVYPSPFSTVSFALGFDEGGVQPFLLKTLDSELGRMFGDIQRAGGLAAYLDRSMDLEGTISGLLGGGIGVGGVELFGARNVMGLLGDIFRQVDKAYVNDFGHTMELLRHVVDRLFSMQVSKYPSTRFLTPFGLGDKTRPGTLGDLANEGMLYAYGRYGDAQKDKFLVDALDGFEHGDNTQRLFNLLLDIVLHDLLEGELLPTLRLHLAPAFPQPLVRLTLGALLDGLLRLVLLGDNRFSAVVDLVFNVSRALDLLPYDSLDGVVDSLLKEYWTPSQDEALGYQLAFLLRRFAYPQDDIPDLDATLRYTGPRKVTPTQEDLRLPSMLAQMLPVAGGEDGRVISWFTKESVKGTDVRVWDKNGNEITRRLDIETSAEAVTREFPGADLGIVGFIQVPVRLTRHTATIGGLEPGRTYTYQVGDAARGWWSPQGTIKTAMDPRYQQTVFLSFTDEQSQTPRQYERAWGKLSGKALELYPGARFIVSAGDQVDSGLNLHQWQWFFDSAQDALLRLPLMPATGNHEDAGAALQQFLPFGDLPVGQGGDSGVYYSFDYNNIHFIVLNTNALADNRLNEGQVNWMREDAQGSDADWKIVVLHKAPYSNGSHYKDEDVIGLREQLTPLLPQLGIDLVISGHDHTYLRTEMEGVEYVIAGTSGVKYYNVTAPEETDKYFPRAQALADAQAPAFAAYTVDGNELRYAAYLMDESGALRRIDSFSIVKPDMEVIPMDTWDFPEDDGPAKSPRTGDPAAVAAIPLSLLLAAGLAMWRMRRKENAAG